MLRALNSGGSGLNAQQLRVDTLANNLANINTTAFKKRRITAFRWPAPAPRWEAASGLRMWLGI